MHILNVGVMLLCGPVRCVKKIGPTKTGSGFTSRPALSAVQVLKIRRPRTDKIVTILQCLYLINGKVK